MTCEDWSYEMRPQKPVDIIAPLLWQERVEQACEVLRRLGYGYDPRVSVEWHEPDEFFDGRVCTITLTQEPQ